MSNTSELDAPNPGSDKAIKLGCTCPVLDNGRGNEELGKTRGFWITGGCPLHDKRQAVLRKEAGDE